jgi:RHS repeat-associated protein
MGDGTQTIYVNSSYQLVRSAQGALSVVKQLIDDRGAAATIKTTATTDIVYCRRDHKANTTDIFGVERHDSESYAIVVAYGEPHLLSGPNVVGARYEQLQWDDQVGLYILWGALLRSFTGRFLTPDTQVGGSLTQADALNRFAFELNNPINNVDLTGHNTRDFWID